VQEEGRNWIFFTASHPDSDKRKRKEILAKIRSEASTEEVALILAQIL